MSQARLYTVKKTRKAWTCSGCREDIPVGSPAINFAVGFRGRSQYRCTKAACKPTRADRESSAVGSVYATIDGQDRSQFKSQSDFEEARDEIVEALDEIISDYESNEMFEINYDLQDRVDMLSGARDEVESLEFDEEPDQSSEEFQDQECGQCDGTGSFKEEGEDDLECGVCAGEGQQDADEDFDEAQAEWLQESLDKFEQAVDNLDI